MNWMKWTALGLVGAFVVWPMIRRQQHPTAEAVRDTANDAIDSVESMVDSARGTV
jgi:hypothetical protein